MHLQGVTNAVASYQNNTYTSKKDSTSTKKQDSISNKGDVAAVYEPSTTTAAASTEKTYTQDTKTIEKLKAEAEKRTEQLRNLVEKLLLKQGEKFTEATNMYQLLREGKLEIDPETAAQAKADIAEDGYYGVKQTSERLFSFAIALTGGDPGKASEMKEAFIKGYEDAKKAWGGELPEICEQTYEATIKKFDEWINGDKNTEGE